jgi:hypothetical protein
MLCLCVSSSALQPGKAYDVKLCPGGIGPKAGVAANQPATVHKKYATENANDNPFLEASQ